MTERAIHFSSKAIEQAKNGLIKRETPNAYVRVGVRGGGCVGYSNSISFEDNKTSRDIEFEFDGLKVIVDPKSIVILDQTTIDYEVGLIRSGFQFINPNAKSHCGCGDSFSVEDD